LGLKYAGVPCNPNSGGGSGKRKAGKGNGGVRSKKDGNLTGLARLRREANSGKGKSLRERSRPS